MSDAYSNMDADTRAAIQDNYIDEQERQLQKRAELLQKYTNGYDRYKKIPLFRNIIDAAVRGADPWDIINRLVDMNTEQAERFKEYLTLHAYPQRIEIK
jgi:hypothetical protein